jgi:RNA polymerase sigma-70 factor (ECF subfamily)
LEIERILSEVEKMDEYHREVLLYRFADGLDNREIAEILSKDEGAVRTQISRALEVLRGKLKDENTIYSND